MASTGECVVRHDWGDATWKLSPDWAKPKVASKVVLLSMPSIDFFVGNAKGRPRLRLSCQQQTLAKRGVCPLAIYLYHNGVPQSLGSRREDKLTWSNLVGALNAQ
jgi:hypothetical protein